MIANALLKLAERAYTWPVLLEQPPFELPVGDSPPLHIRCSVICPAVLSSEFVCAPGVTVRVDGRERHAAIDDSEMGLVPEVQLANVRVGHSLGEPDNRVVRDNSAPVDGRASHITHSRQQRKAYRKESHGMKVQVLRGQADDGDEAQGGVEEGVVGGYMILSRRSRTFYAPSASLQNFWWKSRSSSANSHSSGRRCPDAECSQLECLEERGFSRRL